MVKIIKPAKGTFTTANITIDSSGRVITASSGAGGDGSFFPRLSKKGPASGNLATPANASKYYAYAAFRDKRNPSAIGGGHPPIRQNCRPGIRTGHLRAIRPQYQGWTASPA